MVLNMYILYTNECVKYFYNRPRMYTNMVVMVHICKTPTQMGRCIMSTLYSGNNKGQSKLCQVLELYETKIQIIN